MSKSICTDKRAGTISLEPLICSNDVSWKCSSLRCRYWEAPETILKKWNERNACNVKGKIRFSWIMNVVLRSMFRKNLVAFLICCRCQFPGSDMRISCNTFFGLLISPLLGFEASSIIEISTFLFGGKFEHCSQIQQPTASVSNWRDSKPLLPKSYSMEHNKNLIEELVHSGRSFIKSRKKVVPLFLFGNTSRGIR